MGYEPTIRIVTAFFAALVGFGLKRLLELQPGDELYPYQFLCFVTSIMLFLRFLTGAANHLAIEHDVEDRSAVRGLLFGLDLCFLVTFGIIASYICYSNSVEEFLERVVILLAISTVWGLFVPAIAHCMGHRQRRSWFAWPLLSGIQLAVFSVCLPFAPKQGMYLDMTATLWCLLILSAICLAADFAFQLRNIHASGLQYLVPETEDTATDRDVALKAIAIGYLGSYWKRDAKAVESLLTADFRLIDWDNVQENRNEHVGKLVGNNDQFDTVEVSGTITSAAGVVVTYVCEKGAERLSVIQFFRFNDDKICESIVVYVPLESHSAFPQQVS